MSKGTPPLGLVLGALTAMDLMSGNPVSVAADATVSEAIELLTIRGYSAAPVIDPNGRAVGVVSRSDVLIHDREQRGGERMSENPNNSVSQTRVRDIMTPIVFAVAPNAPVQEIVKQMLDWKVHHLFVIDDSQVLIGVISTLDVLRHLHE